VADGDMIVDTMGEASIGVEGASISLRKLEQDPGQVVDEASEFIVNNVVDNVLSKNGVNTHVDIFSGSCMMVHAFPS
jgi:hypothetical protein